MNWAAAIFAVVIVAIFFWINSKFDRIIGHLEQVNETLASILEAVEK